jgi:hypothetical protein
VGKNRVLREIYGPKMEEGGGDWRELHNEEFFMICTPHQMLHGRSNYKTGNVSIM